MSPKNQIADKITKMASTNVGGVNVLTQFRIKSLKSLIVIKTVVFFFLCCKHSLNSFIFVYIKKKKLSKLHPLAKAKKQVLLVKLG